MKRFFLFFIGFFIFCLVNTIFAESRQFVAIAPFYVHSKEDISTLTEGIYNMLSIRISKTPNIKVLPKERVEAVIGNEKIDEVKARELGKDLGADFFLIGNITKLGKSYSFDISMVWVNQPAKSEGITVAAKGEDDLIPKIDELANKIIAKITGKGEKRFGEGFLYQTRMQVYTRELLFIKRMIISREIRGVALGDVTGDGEKELIFMGKRDISVFKDKGDHLEPVANFEGKRGENFVKLDVIDLNKNGRVEIVVTDFIEDNLFSFLLEFKGKKLQMIEGPLYYFLRVIDIKGVPTLIAQAMGLEDDFIGKIYTFGFKRGKLIKKSVIIPPTKAPIYNFIMGNFIGRGGNDFIIYDKNEKLLLLNKAGRVVAKSSEAYGGSDNFVERERLSSEDVVKSKEEKKRRLYFPLRLGKIDMDRDGKDECIVIDNEFSGGKILERMKAYKDGEILFLTWDGFSLSELLRTKKVVGYISDFTIGDLDRDGKKELIISVISPEIRLFGRTKSAVVIYRLP